MNEPRKKITTLAELALLNDDEVVEGYQDGFDGDKEPGNNRSTAYWHGWRNGNADRRGESDTEQQKLAREAVANWHKVHPK